ncbi:hypothetical protein ACOXVJ_16520 [Pseudomonas knackmussii]|uniref:hypothetical protein n=1 Tax=Pseudomonas knackmussii TaxID=65741 RepID=UPI003BCBC059
MMRRLPIYILSFSALTSAAGETPQADVREYALDSCHFTLIDPYGARIDTDTESPIHSASYISLMRPNAQHSIEVSIRFTCNTNDGLDAFTNLHFKHESGSWSLIPSETDPENLVQAKLYPIRGEHVIGAAHTENQTTGEFTERTQGLVFCLTDQKQILCGISESVGYVAYPKESSLPQVLKLLESIEFIEPTPSPAGAP